MSSTSAAFIRASSILLISVGALAGATCSSKGSSSPTAPSSGTTAPPASTGSVQITVNPNPLLGKGLTLRIYDRNVSLAKLVGANKEYIEQQIPHLSSLLCRSIDEVILKSEVIIVGNQSPEFVEALTQARPDQIVIDLVGLPTFGSALQADYRGICW